jgi:sugar lactone lactonase YvrE
MVNLGTGVLNSFAGNGTSGSSGDGYPANSALVSLIGPTAVAVDKNGNVYIADPQAAKVRVVSGGAISTFAGSGSPGFSGDGGSATAISAKLNFPSGVAVDASGNVYIADSGNHKIRKVSGGIISTFAGSASLGYTGDGGPPTSASLFAPQGVAVDSSGTVYIADTANNVVRKVSNGIITTVAGTGSVGYSGDRGSATAATLNVPRAVSVDSSGNIYIADTGNNVVRKVSTNSVITTVAGNGSNGFSGDNGPAIAAQLSLPTGVAVDPTGGFTYIADNNNNVIRVITNTVTSGVIPHFAAGGGYVTGLYVINKSTSPQAFTINFYNDAGVPVAVPATGGSSTGASLSDTIPALGTGYYELGSLTNPAVVSGSGVVLSNSALVVQVFFRHQGAAVTPYETSYTATLGSFEAEFGFDATVYAPTNTQLYTAIAFANIDGANPATITCVAKDNTGTVIPNAVTVPTLNPQGHWAAYLFPALVGKRGTLDCTSTTRMSPIALKFIGTDGLSTLPVILK